MSGFSRRAHESKTIMEDLPKRRIEKNPQKEWGAMVGNEEIADSWRYCFNPELTRRGRRADND